MHLINNFQNKNDWIEEIFHLVKTWFIYKLFLLFSREALLNM